MSQDSLVEYGFRRNIITITLILCSILELIDTSIVNVATNTLMGNLGATLGEVSWVIAAYGIANVIIVPMSGWLSFTLGRRNYYAGSVIVFTISSLMCGLSDNIWLLVFWRFVQGMGGGALLATAQSMLVEIYPKEKIGQANAMFGMGVIMGPTLGPTLGGFLIDNFDWPWIFYVNIPIGIIASILALTYIRNAPKQANAPRLSIDYIGIILLIIGVGSLQLVLEQGERESWYESRLIVGFTVSAIFGVLAFIWRELTVQNPIVDLRILLKGNVGIGTILNFILGFGLFASVFVYPVFVQRFLGFTATQTGLSLLPGALISGFMMPIMGAMLAKGVKPKYLISTGFFLFFVFTVFTSTKLIATAGEDDFFWPLILRGLSLSMLFVPLASMSFGGLVGRDIASAAGITSMMRQLGGSFSVALVSVFSERWFAQHRVDLISNVTVYSPSTMERLQAYINGLVGRSGSIEKATQQAYAVMENVVSKQAQILTYIDIFFYLGIFFLLCIPLVFFARSFKGKVDTSSAH